MFFQTFIYFTFRIFCVGYFNKFSMIFEGYIVNFDEEKFDKIYRLVGSIANNINQIAVRVNSTNKVYAEDIVNIKEGQDKIWQLLNSLQSKLLRLKR